MRSLHAGAFLADQRNIVLVGGTGTGKTHLAIAITANVVRAGARGRYFNTVDLVNQLEDEARRGKAGALAAQLSRLDLVVLDELGYLPFAQSGGQRLFHLISKLYERTSVDHHHQPGLRRVALRLRRRQDDHGAARPAHPPLRHRRDRQRQLAAQEPILITPRLGCARRLRAALRKGSTLRRRATANISARGVPFVRRSGVPIGRRLTGEQHRALNRAGDWRRRCVRLSEKPVAPSIVPRISVSGTKWRWGKYRDRVSELTSSCLGVLSERWPDGMRLTCALAPASILAFVLANCVRQGGLQCLENLRGAGERGHAGLSQQVVPLPPPAIGADHVAVQRPEFDGVR